jgi:hypothetical protein
MYMKTTTAPSRNSIGRLSSVSGSTLIAFALCCFALSSAPNAFGVSPAPDGGYPGFNTAEGDNALLSLTTGIENTANGFAALEFNSTGSFNTANGVNALRANTGGSNNTANGDAALFSNTNGSDNTAIGYAALDSNTNNNNTAIGFEALFKNTSGSNNTANGSQALYNNTTGSANTASGTESLYSNTGSGNTANGYVALNSNTTGIQNTASGYGALDNNTTGNYNIGLGPGAGFNLTTGSNNIDIGNFGVAGESDKIRIGTEGTQTDTYIAGIHGRTSSGGAAVYVNSSGKLGTMTSSRRFKDQIQPMDKASEAVLALKPVTFHYKKEFDPDGIPQFGLVAEQVEKVNPDLVTRDAKGEVYTVRYEAVNAMLLNEFLKEHRKVQDLRSTVAKQEASIAQQQKAMEAVTARLEEQDSKIQKVSAQLELNKPVPQIVAKNQ